MPGGRLVLIGLLNDASTWLLMNVILVGCDDPGKGKKAILRSKRLTRLSPSEGAAAGVGAER